MGFTYLFGATAVLLLLTSVRFWFHSRWALRLPALKELKTAVPPEGGTESSARCSIVLAARNEEARIEGTIRHWLAQSGVQVELIAVDDRSTDRTTGILQRLAEEDARVRVKRVEMLPDGWLGKCHACHLGAGAATGDWILFTDADCWPKPDVIARALRVAEREDADHITLTPGVAAETAAAKAWHLAFLLTVTDWISGVNRDDHKRHLGIGAFNLMRAPAYQACGGYEALRLTVVDDVKLGFLLRRAGKRTRAFIGGDDVECHWGTTVPQMIRIMEKNYFAAADYRHWAALAVGIGGPLIWCVAIVGPFTGTLAGLAAGLALLSLIIPAAILARRLGWSLWLTALVPFMFLALYYAILNSTMVTLRQGGIRWRDTFYSLEKLRRGNVR